MGKTLPLEIAARAVCRVATAGYPDTPAGRRRADEYVERNWCAVWTQWNASWAQMVVPALREAG